MDVSQFVLTLGSANPDRLVAFYRDVVGLRTDPTVGPGAFLAGSSTFIAFIVEAHGALVGPAKEPERALLNFFVEDVALEETRLRGSGVEFARAATLEPGFGLVATFRDPDRNLCQLIQLDG